MASTSNTRMLHVQDAVSPEEVISLHPITNDMEDQITSARAAISNVLSGIDNRMIVVSGPCSIHNKESALEYARWLKDMQSKHDQLLLVMRVYFEKPRTTVGWKGLVKDPHLDGSCDVNTGLKLARQIMWEIANM
ncbi:MAG: hypothetical protein H6767_04660 [Candidatus Peribacteria bacterium]|nr:MAG: hypothetical protein H6767_04660 [Candidatus Peribacteria bacterium]